MKIDWNSLVSFGFLLGVILAATTGQPVAIVIMLSTASIVAALSAIKGAIESKK